VVVFVFFAVVSDAFPPVGLTFVGNRCLTYNEPHMAMLLISLKAQC